MRHHATVCRAHHPATIRSARPCHRSGNAETCQRSGAPADHCQPDNGSQPEHAQACHKPHRGTERPQAGKLSPQQENRHTEPQRERTTQSPHHPASPRNDQEHRQNPATRHAGSHRTHGNSASHTRTALPPKSQQEATQGSEARQARTHVRSEPLLFPESARSTTDFGEKFQCTHFLTVFLKNRMKSFWGSKTI